MQGGGWDEGLGYILSLPVLSQTNRLVKERDDILVVDHVLDFGDHTHGCYQPQCVFTWIRLCTGQKVNDNAYFIKKQIGQGGNRSYRFFIEPFYDYNI